MTQIIIRSLTLQDAPALTQFINRAASEEKIMISCQGQKFTLAQETAFVRTQLKHIRAQQTVHLIALAGPRIVGTASVEQPPENIKRHLASFGIIIDRAYRHQGLGKRLAQQVIARARQKLPHLQIITLTVFARNLPAQNLYHQLGFQDFGCLPHGSINADNTTEDENFMYLKLPHSKTPTSPHTPK
jgi:RimJ/RimL family protein N-acetyltransferase